MQGACIVGAGVGLKPRYTHVIVVVDVVIVPGPHVVDAVDIGIPVHHLSLGDGGAQISQFVLRLHGLKSLDYQRCLHATGHKVTLFAFTGNNAGKGLALGGIYAILRSLGNVYVLHVKGTLYLRAVHNVHLGLSYAYWGKNPIAGFIVTVVAATATGQDKGNSCKNQNLFHLVYEFFTITISLIILSVRI